MPVVSVLMVFHRDTPFLRPAIASVLGQSLSGLELLLVDNGVGLDPAALGEAARDPRVRLISLPENRGASVGRNAAMAQSRGEFIALLDHDDIALPGRLEKQVALLRAQPRVGLVSCLADSIDEQGTVFGREFALLTEPDQKQFSNYSMPSPASACTGRREIFEQFPFRPELDLAEDSDCLSRVAEAAPICGIPEALVQYRHHSDQCSRERTASQIVSACLVRLITARRRRGRAEDLAAAAGDVARWRHQPPASEEIYAYFAGECLRDGSPLLAAYHARRMLAVRGSFRTVTQALRLLPPALLRADNEAGKLLRLFLTGPLRTHGLVPA
jgi:glycosyltransferase involved in cell wall biosynthesis